MAMLASTASEIKGDAELAVAISVFPKVFRYDISSLPERCKARRLQTGEGAPSPFHYLGRTSMLVPSCMSVSPGRQTICAPLSWRPGDSPRAT